MQLFWFELYQAKKSLLIWCIGVVLLILAGMSKFAALSNAPVAMQDLIMQLPPTLKMMLGLSVFDISTASGFYSVLYLYLALITSVNAVLTGANILSKEERDKTAEFLFTKPYTRSRIVTTKLLAALVQCIVLFVITLLASQWIVGSYAPGDPSLNSDINLLMTGIGMLQMIFLCIGACSAAVFRNAHRAVSFSVAAVACTFILSLFIDISARLDVLTYLTPFKVYDAKTLISMGNMDLMHVAWSVGVMIVALTIVYIRFSKRDLSV